MYHYRVNDDWVAALLSLLRPATMHWEYTEQLTAYREILVDAIQHILSISIRWLNTEWDIFNAKVRVQLSSLIDDTLFFYTKGEAHHFITGKSSIDSALTFIETALREDLINIYSLTNDNVHVYQYHSVVIDSAGTYVILDATIPIPHHPRKPVNY